MQPFKVMTFLLVLLLTACSAPVVEQIEQQTPITQQRVEALGQALSSGQVTNAELINQYAQKIIVAKPDLVDIVNVIARDATTNGPLYKALQDRLEQAQSMPQLFSTNEERYQELLNIYQAADPVLFSDALSDPLNVLADMSDGVLPRVNALSKAQSMVANGAEDFGIGEQLIGNPSYGQWQTGSNGLSFWEWYGMYALMDNLFGSRRVYYNDWGRKRNYSYYSDFGRTRYSSPSHLRKQVRLDNRTRKSFESKGQKYTSAYAKNRTGASSISQKSKVAQTSANRFQKTTTNKSAYASKSKKNASFRNSRTNTSRGTRRGK